MRFSRVTPEGAYVPPPPANSKASYATMLYVRADIVRNAGEWVVGGVMEGYVMDGGGGAVVLGFRVRAVQWSVSRGSWWTQGCVRSSSRAGCVLTKPVAPPPIRPHD